MARYYYSKTGSDVEGPVGKADLIKMYSAGIVDDNTQICLEQEDSWNPISTIVPPSAEALSVRVKNILRLACDLLAMENYEQADEQATLVLQYAPGNAEAWLCKGIIAASPKIKVEDFGIRNVVSEVWDNVYEELQPAVRQTEMCFDKALKHSCFDPEFRDVLSSFLVSIAADRYISPESRVVDSAAALVNFSKKFGSGEKRKGILRLAFAWMTIIVYCLSAAYELEPSPSIASLVQSLNVLLLKLHAGDTATSLEWGLQGLPLFRQLEARINSEHPQWLTQPTKEQREQIGDVQHWIKQNTFAEQVVSVIGWLIFTCVMVLVFRACS